MVNRLPRAENHDLVPFERNLRAPSRVSATVEGVTQKSPSAFVDIRWDLAGVAVNMCFSGKLDKKTGSIA